MHLGEEVAKAKDEAAAVTWVCADAGQVPLFDADLAVMTDNVAQVVTLQVPSNGCTWA